MKIITSHSPTYTWEQNFIADIPSCSFGGDPAVHCRTDNNFLTMFYSMFPSLSRHCGRSERSPMKSL
ncbi:hypothetical protein ACHAW6_012077 [Cyclotella cf. meneghiniana]